MAGIVTGDPLATRLGNSRRPGTVNESVRGHRHPGEAAQDRSVGLAAGGVSISDGGACPQRTRRSCLYRQFTCAWQVPSAIVPR